MTPRFEMTSIRFMKFFLEHCRMLAQPERNIVYFSISPFAFRAVRFDAILYHRINEVFGYLPLAAVVGEKIFCCHGGLSPDLRDLKQVACMDRPIPEVPQEGLVCDLLWADPYMVMRSEIVEINSFQHHSLTRELS